MRRLGEAPLVACGMICVVSAVTSNLCQVISIEITSYGGMLVNLPEDTDGMIAGCVFVVPLRARDLGQLLLLEAKDVLHHRSGQLHMVSLRGLGAPCG